MIGQYFTAFGLRNLIECAEWDANASPSTKWPPPQLQLDELRLQVLLDAMRLLVYLLRDRSTYARKVLLLRPRRRVTLTIV